MRLRSILIDGFKSGGLIFPGPAVAAAAAER